MSCYVKSVSKSTLLSASNAVRGATELKYFDAHAGALSLSTTFTFATPDTIAIGTSPNQRVGRAIRITGMDVCGWFTPADVSNGVRVTIGVREGGYAAAPNVTVGNYHYSGLNPWEEKTQFLSDQYIGFAAQSYSGATTYPVVPYTKHVGFGKKGILVRFNSSNHISQNMPFVAFISDSAAVLHPQFLGYVRFYYTDE